MKLIRQTLINGLGLTVMLLSTLTYATSILQLSFEELVQKSAFVFEGEVIASDTQWNENRSRIYTLVTFRINEVIKGQALEDTFTLSFSGGKVEQETQYIEDLVYPKVGEAGIYFVERTDIRMLNPLLGWSQGHFLVDGETVMTNNHETVVDIEPVSESEQTEFKLSKGSVKGLRTVNKLSDGSPGMTAAEFKQRIREHQP